MKKSLVAASLLLAASAVLADSNAWFVGGEFGGMSIHGKTSASASSSFSGYSFWEGSSSESIDATYEALKVGKYFEYGRVSTEALRIKTKKKILALSRTDLPTTIFSEILLR